MNTSKILFHALIGFLLLVPSTPLYAAQEATVFVSILPQKYFIQQIAGDLVHVEVMVRPGASPATYEPKSSQMRDLAKALAYFAIGVPFERAWLERIAGVNAHMQIVHTEAGIKKLAMASHDHDHDDDMDEAHVGHESHGQHGHEGHGHNQGLDPHIWLSPLLVKQQATTIAKALVELFPAHQAVFTAHLQNFLTRIDTLDQELQQIFAGKQGMKFMVFHPSWGYFAQAYGLHQLPLEVEGKAPKPAQLKALIEQSRREKIQVIFAQPQFSRKSADLVAREMGGTVLLIDPLAEDWLNNMKIVAEKLRATLR